MHDQIVRLVIKSARVVRVEDILRALGITDLSIDRATGHMRDHGVSTAPWALDIAERVVLWCGLREPNITTITTELARLDGFGDVLLDDDGSTSGVDKPRPY